MGVGEGGQFLRLMRDQSIPYFLPYGKAWALKNESRKAEHHQY